MDDPDRITSSGQINQHDVSKRETATVHKAEHNLQSKESSDEAEKGGRDTSQASSGILGGSRAGTGAGAALRSLGGLGGAGRGGAGGAVGGAAGTATGGGARAGDGSTGAGGGGRDRAAGSGAGAGAAGGAGGARLGVEEVLRDAALDAVGVLLRVRGAAVALGALHGALGGVVDLALVGHRDTGAVSPADNVSAAVLEASLLGRGGSGGAGGGRLGRDDDGSAESEKSSEAHLECVVLGVLRGGKE